MYINYSQVDEELNKYAIDATYDIMEKHGKYMTKEQIITYENKIAENRIVIVNSHNEDDEKFFKGKIPVAHGPRAKKDGYIHVYPFIYKNADTEKAIYNYINGGVILHELYHYIIRLDIKESTDKKRISFGHYLTEGMVELFTEQHSNNKYTRWSARRNVDAAEDLYEYLSEKEDIVMLFHNNFEEIFDKYPELEYIYSNYLKENEFMKELTNLLNSYCKQKRLNVKKILAKFNRSSLKEAIDNLCLESIEYLGEEEAKEFNELVSKIYLRTFEKKEKSLN